MPPATDLGRDLVLATIPGVQRFIADSRSTADMAASSRLMSDLTRAMRSAVVDPAEVVLPAAGDTGLPNRVVALTEAGSGVTLARRMAREVQQAWAGRVAALWPAGRPKGVPEAPGFPQVQWVVVEPLSGGYPEQWARAQDMMAARKRTRTFPGYDKRDVWRLCGLSAQWPAVRDLSGIRGVRRRRGEHLSVPALVKRADRAEGFPSTWSVATAPFRRALAARATADADVRSALRALREAVQALSRHRVRFGGGVVPGLTVDPRASAEVRWLTSVEGACLVPETWSARSLAAEYDLPTGDDPEFVAAVGAAGEVLRQLLSVAKLPAPSPYLAVVAQDADRMGERLSKGHPGLRAWHGEVSTALLDAATRQREVLEAGGPDGALGRLVYAGGDDALAFVPAISALPVAAALNDAFRAAVAGTNERPGVIPTATASTAVVFFHAGHPLQSTITVVQELLHEAKEASRPGFGVAVIRRGGERVRALHRWSVGSPLPDGTSAPAALHSLVGAMRAGLSGRIAGSLARDAAAIASLSDGGKRGEVRRLVLRHGASHAHALGAANALIALAAGQGDEGASQHWATVARFVAAEGR